MRYFAKMLLLMAALLASVSLVACGDEHGGGESVSGGKYIEGNIYPESRWAALEGTFLLDERLVPVAIDATLLDEDLDSVGTVEVALRRHRDGGFDFVSDSMEFSSSLLRIRYTCVYADSSSGLKMDFVQYVDIESDGKPELSLVEALGSARIEFLVQEDGFYLDIARQKAMREIRAMFGSDWNGDMSLNYLLYRLCIVEKADSAFYAGYGKLRDAVGDGKTWRDLLSEVEIADTLFGQGRLPELWAEVFGLPACDTSNFKDTASVTEKKSAHYKEMFVCGNATYINKYEWRAATEFEKEKGVCTPDLRDTVEFGHVAYICPPTKAEWQKMSEKQGIPYLYGECNSELEGDSVLYDSTYYTCVVTLFSWTGTKEYGWKIPDGQRLTDPVNIFVRKHEGLCEADRSKEKVAIEGKYYMCVDSAWKEIDRYTYFLGECDSLGWDKRGYHDSIGYFICKKDWPGSQWTEVLIPDYYGDECKPELAGYVKEYEGSLYICRAREGFSNSHWEIPSYTELAVPTRKGNLCEKANEGEVVEYDGVGYRCVFPVWKNASDYELKVHRAMVRNKFKPNYCANGSSGTTIFWDETDSAFYGCVEKYTEANYGWGLVKRDATKSTSFAEFKNAENLVGGIYEDNDHYTITKDGWKYTFSYYTSGVNDDNIRVLRLQKVVTNTGATIDVYENDIMVFRAAFGDSAAALDAVDGKSASFDAYFADWKQKVIETTGCPSAVSGIDCVPDWDETTFDVVFDHYNGDSYTTWEQAKDFCPEGSRIPSAEEWLYKNYADTYYFKDDRALRVRQKMASGKYGSFDVKYNFVWTSTEKDSETQYCLEYAKVGSSWYQEKTILSGIVECPKDLFPMVQAVCVSDGRIQ